MPNGIAIIQSLSEQGVSKQAQAHVKQDEYNN